MMFLRHLFVPHQFLLSVIVPIIKDRCGDITDVNSYRGIAISSVISKVLELVLLNRIASLLVTKEQQFGFKRKHSCADCSFVLRSAVAYYLKREMLGFSYVLWTYLKPMIECRTTIFLSSYWKWECQCTL